MDDPVIVKNDALASLDVEPHQVFLVGKFPAEPNESGIKGIEVMLRQIEHICHVLADRDARYGALFVKLDHPLARAHVICVMLAIKGYPGFAQNPEIFGRFVAEVFRDCDAVQKEIVSPFNRICAAMEELNAGRQILGRCIGVQFKCLGGIGKIRRLDVRADITLLSEECGPECTYIYHTLCQTLIAVGPVSHERDAFPQHCLQPIGDSRRVRAELFKRHAVN